MNHGHQKNQLPRMRLLPPLHAIKVFFSSVNGRNAPSLLPRVARCLDSVLGADRLRARIISDSNFPIAAGLASLPLLGGHDRRVKGDQGRQRADGAVGKLDEGAGHVVDLVELADPQAVRAGVHERVLEVRVAERGRAGVEERRVGRFVLAGQALGEAAAQGGVADCAADGVRRCRLVARRSMAKLMALRTRGSSSSGRCRL